MFIRSIKTVITRDSHEESTVAVIDADLEMDDDVWPSAENDLLPRLRRAVTAWVSETKDGRLVWQQSNHDLNIGDVALFIDRAGRTPTSFWPYMTRQGIKAISVYTASSDVNRDWSFDSHLVITVGGEPTHAYDLGVKA
jgi:hypothetical protein